MENNEAGSVEAVAVVEETRADRLKTELMMSREQQMQAVLAMMDERLRTEGSLERKLADKQAEEAQRQVKHMSELRAGEYSSGRALSEKGKEKRKKSEDRYYGFLGSDVAHAFDLATNMDPMDGNKLGGIDEAGLDKAVADRQKDWEGIAQEWSRMQGFAEGLVEAEDWEGAAKVLNACTFLVQGGMVEKVREKIKGVERDRGRDAASQALVLVDALGKSEWVDDGVKDEMRVETAGARGYELYVKGVGGEFKGGGLGSPDRVDGIMFHAYLERVGLPFDQDEVKKVAEESEYNVWDFARPGVTLARLAERARGKGLGEVEGKVVAGMLVEGAKQVLASEMRTANNFGNEKATMYAAEMLLAADGVKELEREVAALLMREGDVRVEMERIKGERARMRADKEIDEKAEEVAEPTEPVVSVKEIVEEVKPVEAREGLEEIEALGKVLEDLQKLINGQTLVEIGIDQTDPVFRLKVFTTGPAYTLDMLKGPKYRVGGEGERARLADRVMEKYLKIRENIEDPLDRDINWVRAYGMDGMRGRKVVAADRKKELNGRLSEIQAEEGWGKDEEKVVEWAANRLAWAWAVGVKHNQSGGVVA